jgi:hypothetical protein
LIGKFIFQHESVNKIESINFSGILILNNQNGHLCLTWQKKLRAHRILCFSMVFKLTIWIFSVVLNTTFYFHSQVLWPRNKIVFSIFISLSMPLTGLSLEMYIFHFEAISLSTHISGSKRPIFTNLDSLERSWPVDGS